MYGKNHDDNAEGGDDTSMEIDVTFKGLLKMYGDLEEGFCYGSSFKKRYFVEINRREISVIKLISYSKSSIKLAS